MPIKPGFSAIELLIVAGITAILVAIAVPNFIEAKVRAEVVDVRVTLRECHSALVQYSMSYNAVPGANVQNGHPLDRLFKVGFLNNAPVDRFKQTIQNRDFGPLYADPYIGYDNLENPMSRKVYVNAKMFRGDILNSNLYGGPAKYWALRSIGPDQTDFQDEGLGRGTNQPNPMGLIQYDSSNGIFSLGDIVRPSHGY